MTTATFDARSHIYEADGVIVPSVTQVLALAGLSDVSGIPSHILERARRVGEDVHMACEFFDNNDLAIETVPEDAQPYFEAYCKFREETGFKPTKIEYRTIVFLPEGTWGYPVCGFGMCADRVGEFPGSDTPVVLDLKTSSRLQSHWTIQTAGYAYGLGMETALEHDRLVVHLAKDRTYKLHRHLNLGDADVWLAALRVATWKLANGAKLEKIL